MRPASRKKCTVLWRRSRVCGVWQSEESGQCNKRTTVSSGRKKLVEIMHWSWQTYGMHTQNGTQKNFPGTWYSLLPQFFLISFPHPASQHCERYVCVYVCVYVYVYIHIHAYIWLPRDWIEVLLLTNNTCCKWNMLHKSGAVWSVDWIFSIAAPPWQWMGEYEIQVGMFYHPHNKPLIQVSEWEPDEHPLPTTMTVAVFR